MLIDSCLRNYPVNSHIVFQLVDESISSGKIECIKYNRQGIKTTILISIDQLAENSNDILRLVILDQGEIDKTKVLAIIDESRNI